MTHKNLKLSTFPILIEIPKGTVNEKWEYDHKTGKMVLDFVFSNLVWPFNYGEVVGSRGGDGDALDAVVFSSAPLAQSSVVECVPVGVVLMLDRGEVDDKLFFVPANDPLGEKYKDISDFSDKELKDMREFYMEIARQKHKTIIIKKFASRDEALEILQKGFCQSAS